MSEDIFLNDVLRLKETDIENTKIRFNLQFGDNWNPIEVFEQRRHDDMLRGQYWNYNKKRSYRNGQITIGFARISTNEDSWLLFHVGKVTKDLGILNGVGYEYESLPEYEKYCGRLIVKFKNNSQNMVRNASSVINDCEVWKILPDVYENDDFPGYENVRVSWSQLAHCIQKESWSTALRNQKGVYLITDAATGKMYVGSAYGENMILGCWQAYINTGHGGNIELRNLSFDHIKKKFSYSILDIFRAGTDDQIIIDRESYWKDVLLTREFGYNNN